MTQLAFGPKVRVSAHGRRTPQVLLGGGRKYGERERARGHRR